MPIRRLAAALVSVALCGSAMAGTAGAKFAVSVAAASKCSIVTGPTLAALSVTCTAGSIAPRIALARDSVTVEF